MRCFYFGKTNPFLFVQIIYTSLSISKADFKSKSYIALKEARESLYWMDLLHRNSYLSDTQYKSIYADCEELVKVLVHRCKKLDENGLEK